MPQTTEPIAPRHPGNPVGQTEKISRAMKAVRRDLLRLQKQVIREWEGLPVRVQNVGLHNQFYEYLIDVSLLRAIVASVRQGMAEGQCSA